MYGYRLVEDENQAPMVYYNVKFFRNATLLTYPEWTVRYILLYTVDFCLKIKISITTDPILFKVSFT